MSELNRRLSALAQQSHDATPVLQAATIKPLPNKRGRYGMAILLMAVILLFAGGVIHWLRVTVTPVITPLFLPVAAVPVVSTLPTIPTPIKKQASNKPELSIPELISQEAVRSPSPMSVDAESMLLAAMPVAEPALDTLDIKQELASSYEQGYDSGYQQAFVEQQSTITASPKIEVVVSPKPVVSRLSIETVALTPIQLAMVEYNNAEKVLRQANSRQAIVHLEAALKYRPEWVIARQKLAALYYGRGDNRQAVAMLQQGLQRQPHSTELRLTLAKLLVNEQQPQTALTVLEQAQVVDSVSFLAMRAALAQQLQKTALALSSYQQLVLHDATDGRWWLGLAIAQERSQQFTAALTSYRQGAVHGGLSVASQQFIQQRIMALQTKRH